MTPLDALADSILAEFRAGNDTLEIARARNMPESKVARLMWVARCRDKGLPATFVNRANEIRRIATEIAA